MSKTKTYHKQVNTRLTLREWRAWQRAAKREGVTLAVYVRRTINAHLALRGD